MSLIDAKLEFSDNQDVKANAISSNVFDLASLGDSYRQLGFIYWNTVVSAAITGGQLSATLTTKATEPSDDSGTTLAKIIIPSGAVAGTAYSVQVPLATALRWVGVYYIDVDTAISAANVDSWLGMEPINQSRNIQPEPA